MNEQLQKKVDFAIRLLQGAEKMAEKVGQPVEICYSGGKDSDVILELARMSGIKYRAIYKNTTIDPPGTIKHALDNGCEIRRPSMSFREIIAKKGIPNRNRRHCCEILKEYKILDYAVIGVRKEESKKRNELYNEPELCYKYKSEVTVRQYLPILEWTKEDIKEFITERNIKCHPIYYDEKGHFHVERRLGCMGCPLAYRKHRIEEFKRNPNMVKLYIDAAQKFLDNHPKSAVYKYLNNAVDLFAFSLYCDTIDEFKDKFGPNLFHDGLDCKEVLEQTFNIKL